MIDGLHDQALWFWQCQSVPEFMVWVSSFILLDILPCAGSKTTVYQALWFAADKESKNHRKTQSLLNST